MEAHHSADPHHERAAGAADAPPGAPAPLTRPGTGALLTGSSIGLCVVVVLQLLAGMLAMVFVVPRFIPIFEDFDTELPTLTRWLIAAPSWFTLLVGLGLTAALVVKEFLLHNRRVTLTMNAVMMFVLLLLLPVLIFALFRPLVALMESVM